MAEKRPPTPKKKEAAPADAAPAADAPKVLGPGVVKRPKRDPAAPPAPGDEPNYQPSEQVFRRRR